MKPLSQNRVPMSQPLLVSPTGSTLVGGDTSVRDLTERGAIVLSHFHVIAQHLNWSIRCEKCGESVQGFNSGEERYLAVRCGCTEYRAEVSTAARARLGS